MHRKSSIVSLVFLALAATSLGAQTKIYNSDNLVTGSCNVIPFGNANASTIWSNQKYQTIVPKTKFGTKVGPICSLGFLPCSTSARSFASIEIKMDYFPGKGSTLGTTFSTNMTSQAVTVLSAKNYTWNHTAGVWSHIGLQKPFIYIPARGHLVVQITVTGAKGGVGFRRGGKSGTTNVPNVQRMYATGSKWSNGVPPATGTLSTVSGLKMELGFDAWAIDSFGAGCPGSNNTVPKLTLSGSGAIGKVINVQMTGALPKAPTYFIVGLKAHPTPVDMTPMGAAGCNIHISLDVIATVPTDSVGTYSGKFTIPNNTAFICAQIFLQFFPLDAKVNAFGTSSSNYARLVVGR